MVQVDGQAQFFWDRLLSMLSKRLGLARGLKLMLLGNFHLRGRLHRVQPGGGLLPDLRACVPLA